MISLVTNKGHSRHKSRVGSGGNWSHSLQAVAHAQLTRMGHEKKG